MKLAGKRIAILAENMYQEMELWVPYYRLREEGAISDGMLPKSSAIESAIRGGVRRVHVISYADSDALLAEIFTNEGKGTLVVADTKALTAAEQGK